MSKDFELLRRIGIARRDGVNEPRQEIYSGYPPRSRTTDPQTAQFAIEPSPQPAPWVKAAAVLRKRWKFVASVAFTGAAIVVLIVLLIKPEYEPTARIEIDPPGTETFSMQTAANNGGEAQYLETQAQNLQTDDLAISVIRKMGLDRNPEFAKSAHQQHEASEPDSLTPAENQALLTLRSRLRVSHDPNSRIIAVSIAAHDPKLAADVTNSLAQAFVERTIKMKHEAISNSRAWLENQLKEVRLKAEQANQDLAAFEKRTGVADIDEDRNSFGDMMTDLNRQTTQAGAERIQLESYLQKANERGGVDSLPQVRDNPVVQKLTQTLADVRAQISENSVIYGANHPSTRKLQNQKLELEKQLSVQRKEALDQLRLSYNAARAREELMSAKKREATKMLADMAEYNILKKQAQAQSTLYNTLLGRIEEAGISAASQSTSIRIADPARVLPAPTRPRRMRDIALGIFAALFAGIALTFVWEKFDSPLRLPEDVRDLTGIPAVSIIPEFCKNGVRALIPNWPRSSGHIDAPSTFLLDRPHSPEAEAVRGLGAHVLLTEGGQQQQCFVVASSLPGEGKTTVAVNLALALSQHRRTCLVDADLRRPCVASACGLDNHKGLGDVLTGSLPLQDALLAMNSSPGLFVLPGGAASDERAHAIASTAMQPVMHSLRSLFDYIVIDSAPILPYAEGRVLSTMADGIIFVARSGVTPRAAMLRSMELLHEFRCPGIIKVIFNAYTFPQHNLYYYPYTGR